MKDIINNMDVYKTIVENLGEEIFITDGEGNVLFVNPASIEINELDLDNIVGRNVRELMNEGYFSESSTLRVLRERKPVSVLQYLKNGKRIIASGFPIFDDAGNIEMVITSSQDIDAVNHILEALERQQEEIYNLKMELSEQSNFEANDPASMETKASLDKLASLDIPILIYGESGTGKTTAARHIHFSGKRREKPFITVNCTSSDPDFLEREVFGYEKESVEGNSRKIARGKLDFADEGTLVLNNIGYMPRKVQAKLFEYIDTGKFKRAEGSSDVRSSARIIALTGMDLKELSETGMFMKPLYYRLDTIPVRIPPLRSRTSDIPHLANKYIARYNEKYSTKKIISKDALGILTSHTWPGNLIELDQTMESAYIMTDGPVIKGDVIHNIIHGSSEKDDDDEKVYCSDIMPLKEAKHLLEEHLVRRAIDVYKTTRKAAEVLEVNQSTVSRIASKYLK